MSIKATTMQRTTTWKSKTKAMLQTRQSRKQLSKRRRKMLRSRKKLQRRQREDSPMMTTTTPTTTKRKTRKSSLRRTMTTKETLTRGKSSFKSSWRSRRALKSPPKLRTNRSPRSKNKKLLLAPKQATVPLFLKRKLTLPKRPHRKDRYCPPKSILQRGRQRLLAWKPKSLHLRRRVPWA